ncbi:hypothetical protein F9B85_10565 [Heliorestis acidaminivorans]|uniref:Type II secretion system protein GspF domain-containing protein n=2 Tax=Heliorestis acidaminivorans TaxID=553427 RepID=A0A6I0F496_9FIRM|nr:hypothetical protein F9B85_10565 [Heliorestis acidaminivorans]
MSMYITSSLAAVSTAYLIWALLEKSSTVWIPKVKEPSKLIKSYENLESLLKKSLILRFNGHPIPGWAFLVLCFFIGALVGWQFKVWLNNPMAGVLLAGLSGYMVFHVLKIELRWNKERIVTRLPRLFLTLLNHHQASGNPVQSMAEVSDYMDEPLRSLTANIAGMIQSGVSVKKAVRLTQERVENRLFVEFLKDYGHIVEFGGDMASCIKAYVEEAIAQSNRAESYKTEMSANIMLGWIFLGITIGMFFYMTATNPEMMNLLRTSNLGKWAVVSIIIISSFSMYMTYRYARWEGVGY